MSSLKVSQAIKVVQELLFGAQSRKDDKEIKILQGVIGKLRIKEKCKIERVDYVHLLALRRLVLEEIAEEEETERVRAEFEKQVGPIE